MLNRDTWDDITPLLDEALARDSQERTAWLASLRARNPQFAAGLESLLDEHSQLDLEGFLDDEQSSSSVSSGLSGQTIGPYTLVSKIGQGGMGSVWLADRNDGL